MIDTIEREVLIAAVRVVESGFASLTATEAVREELRQGNVGGWKHELADLERYAQTVAV